MMKKETFGETSGYRKAKTPVMIARMKMTYLLPNISKMKPRARTTNTYGNFPNDSAVVVI